MKEKPIVSVICITYGHEEYIAQALDSFLMQKTDFPFQILVGEDKGPDRTAEIVLSYAEKYPDIIVPFIREENMGAQRNLIDLCSRAGTKYLAFCEGDDYWTDEYKLQKQYELMEAHPEYNACFHNTMIMADSSWYLYNYYKRDKDDNIFIPESIPNYDTSLTEMRTDYYIKFGPAHTSSLFYRWDYNKEIPEWYYRHIYGDHSLVMIQVGDGLIGYIPEAMSVYRRSEVGVLMYETRTDHFLKSRGSWIEMAVDIEKHYLKHYGLFANEEIRERIVQEFNNYVRYIINSNDYEKISEAYKEYAYPASLAIEENAKNKRTIGQLKQLYDADGLNMLLRSKELQKDTASTIEKITSRDEATRQKRIQERLDSYAKDINENAEKNLWVFGQENQSSYEGNVRHLYEYILAFHPEIKPIWITRSKGLIKLFESEGMPYARIGSDECREVMERASVAFVNNYKTQAYDTIGFNKRTKIVRLGEGVRTLEKDTNNLYEVSIRTVPHITAEEVISNSPEKFDMSMLTKANESFFTEDYPGTFLQIAMNERDAQYYEKTGIPSDSIVIGGSPRSFAVNNKPYDYRKTIIVCAGARENILDQEDYADNLLQYAERINDLLGAKDIYARIIIPSNYRSARKLREKTEQYISITVADIGEDVYSTIENYDAMITDWSSAMFDFAIKDKPVVIMNPKFDEMKACERLILDEDAMPGIITDNWEEAFEQAIKRIQNPSIDSDKRKKALDIAFEEVPKEDASEKIITEVKRRLGFDS